MNSFSLLEASAVVARFEVVDHKQWNQGFYNRIEVELKGGAKLFIREYVDERIRRYSYHWQSSDNTLICRWDNAPHHKELVTFPFHCHEGSAVKPSTVMTLEEVLAVIEKEQ